MPNDNDLTDIVMQGGSIQERGSIEEGLSQIEEDGELAKPLEFALKSVGHPYDPVKKIASLLTVHIERQKKKRKRSGASVGGEDDSDDSDYDDEHQDDYQGPDFFSDYFHDRQHIQAKQLKCDVPVLLLARYLARVLNNSKGALEYILDNSEGTEVIAKIGLVAMREKYIGSKRTNLDPRYAELLKLKLENIAREFALQIYEKMAFKLYLRTNYVSGKNCDNTAENQATCVDEDQVASESIDKDHLASESVDAGAINLHNSPSLSFRPLPKSVEKQEDYQLHAKSFVPMNPPALIAANALYGFLGSFVSIDERLRTIASPRELAILVGCKALRDMVRDEKIGSEIDTVLQGRCNLRMAVYTTVAYYNLALMEGKTR